MAGASGVNIVVAEAEGIELSKVSMCMSSISVTVLVWALVTPVLVVVLGFDARGSELLFLTACGMESCSHRSRGRSDVKAAPAGQYRAHLAHVCLLL